MRTVALAMAATLFLPSVAVADEQAPPTDRFFAYDQLEALGEAAGYFVTRGYVAAVCNVRGSGDSPGHLDPFSAQELWTTGRVGQMGVSYGGHSTLLAAVTTPPHLAAIIPVDGISDWYENTIYRGDIYSARIRPWQQSTAPDTLVTYAQHPYYDDFWRERSVKARWRDLDVPTLEIAGWYDPYRDGMVADFQARKENVWLVAGPWQHGMPAGQYADIAPARSWPGGTTGSPAVPRPAHRTSGWCSAPPRCTPTSRWPAASKRLSAPRSRRRTAMLHSWCRTSRRTARPPASHRAG
jgi:predicted acyl esterase